MMPAEAAGLPSSAEAMDGVEPFFIDSAGGPLFCVHHRPPKTVEARGQVLVALPFNEEMNRCRSLVTLQARAFAAIGVGTLVVDLFGTGDSGGEYRDARWDVWLENLETGLRWLDGQPGSRRAVLGIRLGGILAAQLLRQRADAGLSLMLWQPVIDGAQNFNQFLRIRLAAQMQRADLPKETSASLRQQLAEGKNIEIAGYEIPPQLATAIEAANLKTLAPPAGTPVFWLEQRGVDASLPPASQKLHSAWAEAGVHPTVALYDGPAFWQVYERDIAGHAVELTTEWLGTQWGQA